MWKKKFMHKFTNPNSRTPQLNQHWSRQCWTMEVRGWKKLKFLSAKKFSRLIVATIARPRQTFVMTTIIQVSLLGTKVTILIGSARCYSNSIPKPTKSYRKTFQVILHQCNLHAFGTTSLWNCICTYFYLIF